MGAIALDCSVETVRPWDLVPGDVVLLDDGTFDVLCEPFTGVAGTSPFDVSELFWRVRVRPVAAPARAGWATWSACDVVSRLRHHHGATDPSAATPTPTAPRRGRRR
jgi:hypothetical protein